MCGRGDLDLRKITTPVLLALLKGEVQSGR